METIKTWTVTEITTDDGEKTLRRESSGFSTIELLGILEYTRADIMQMMADKSIPDKVSRVVNVNKK